VHDGRNAGGFEAPGDTVWRGGKGAKAAEEAREVAARMPRQKHEDPCIAPVHPRSIRAQYTLGAAIRNFPYKYVWERAPYLRSMWYSWLLLLPFWAWVDYKLHQPGVRRPLKEKFQQSFEEFKEHNMFKQREADHEHFGWKPGH